MATSLPRLDTSAETRVDDIGDDDGSRRFSFLYTPAEYQSPTFPSRSEDGLSDIAESPRTGLSGGNTIDRDPHRPSILPTARTPSPVRRPNTTSPPPMSEHPANFAPYAETSPTEQHVSTQFVQPQLQPRVVSPARPPPAQTPSFPALKKDQPREKQWNVIPDTHPLTPTTPPPTFPPMSPIRSPRLGTGEPYEDPTHQPGQAVHPNQLMMGGTWSHSLCDCTDVGVCCTGFLCPCILYGRTQYRLFMKSEKKDPTNLLGYTICNKPCTAMALLCGCQWILTISQHVRIRRAYKMQGSIASDYMRALCCPCCTLIQDEREIKRREERARSNTGGSLPLPYKSPTNMSFSPPPR